MIGIEGDRTIIEFDTIPIIDFDTMLIIDFDTIPIIEFDAIPIIDFDTIPIFAFDTIPIIREISNRFERYRYSSIRRAFGSTSAQKKRRDGGQTPKRLRYNVSKLIQYLV